MSRQKDILLDKKKLRKLGEKHNFNLPLCPFPKIFLLFYVYFPPLFSLFEELVKKFHNTSYLVSSPNSIQANCTLVLFIILAKKKHSFGRLSSDFCIYWEWSGVDCRMLSKISGQHKPINI